MLIHIIKHILSIIPFLGIAVALFMIIPESWFTRRKVVIIGFSSLLFYNLFAPTRCFPHALCFLNQREGLDNPDTPSSGTSSSMSNQVALNNSKITKLSSDVEDSINSLVRITQGNPPFHKNPIMENLIHWSDNTPLFEKTAISAQGALAKAKKKGDAGSKSSSKVKSEEARMKQYS